MGIVGMDGDKKGNKVFYAGVLGGWACGVGSGGSRSSSW